MKNLLTDTASPVTLRIPDFKHVYMTLVGCGGTGSHIASGLAPIVQALAERSISADLFFVDPDKVEPKNVGRQLFSPSDIGRYKAEVLAERFNGAYGLRIMCAARPVDVLDLLPNPTQLNDLHLVIGAVDNPAARATMADVVKTSHERYGTKSAHSRLWWLDCGNENHSGQVLLGNVALKSAMRGAIALGLVDRLPAPSVVYPDLVATPKKQNAKRGQSCADLTASGEQSLMINRLIASWALSMLHNFLVTRDLRYFGVAVDQQWAGLRTYTIDAPTIAEACGLAVDDVIVKAKEVNHGKARVSRHN